MALSMLLLAAGCAALPPGEVRPKPASHALDPSPQGTLGGAFAPLAGAHAGESGFRLVSTGLDGLTARIELIDAAQRSIDLQYYIFRADDSGNLVAQALLRAADRGVRIRLLVDDADTLPGDERILALAANPGMQVRIFNPLRYRGHSHLLRSAEFLFEKARLDYRMHNKLLVADNTVAIIGGRNIGDQYFQIDPASQFGDDDVVTIGPIVRKLSGTFDEFWNCAMATPAQAIDPRHASNRALSGYLALLAAYRQRLDAIESGGPKTPARTPLADIVAGRAPLAWSPVELTYDSPDKKAVETGAAMGRLIYKPVAARVSAVDKELLMVTPYFVPSPDELAMLHDDRDRHAHVRVLTNSLESTPNVAAHSGYMQRRPGLLRMGVELHEIRAKLGNTRGSGQSKAISRYGNYGLHGKLYVFDRKTLFIGSMNFDERSKYLNTEIGLLIDSPELSRDIARRFESLTELDNAYAPSIDGAPTARNPRLLWTTKQAGEIVRYRVEPARSAWQRFQARLLSLLPLDREL
jgi:putative cardiolipin synthase